MINIFDPFWSSDRDLFYLNSDIIIEDLMIYNYISIFMTGRDRSPLFDSDKPLIEELKSITNKLQKE